MSQAEFKEIGHSGGVVTIEVIDGPNGRRVGTTWRHSRPVPSALFSVWALPQGIVVGTCIMGGMADPEIAEEESKRLPKGIYQVLIGSDSEGRFGHVCPACNEYWRSSGMPCACPYCGVRGEPHEFLTKAQRAYVQQYMHLFWEAVNNENPGQYKIDLDAVAEAAGKDAPKPAFYYVEQSQQKKFKCSACSTFNDILGHYGYCSGCGARNDYDELQSRIRAIRDRVNTGQEYEHCVRDAVSAFDSFCGPYMQQLLAHVPLTPRRSERLGRLRFHQLGPLAEEFKNVFDIDVLKGIAVEDAAFVAKMFHRRHVYEHKGGEADETYIQDSGDATVKPKQALRETQETANKLLSLVDRMGRNLHEGFHEIVPPNPPRP